MNVSQNRYRLLSFKVSYIYSQRSLQLFYSYEDSSKFISNWWVVFEVFGNNTELSFEILEPSSS